MTYDLIKLNQAQLEAVTTTEGYVRVIAGAGSGKTRALTHRFAYLVNDIGIMPGNILCVTFTNKAASEMRRRIQLLTGDNDTGYISTFHGFCVSVLQEDSHAVQYPKSFLVLDNPDIDAMLSMVYEERGLTLRDMTFGRARDMIEMIKIDEKPDYYEDLLNMSLDMLYDKYQSSVSARDIIFYGYLYQQKKCFGLDYNDLIKITLHIFREHEDIRLKWQKRLEYIMIDEFQDIDKLQYELMEVLCGYHKNLFIVGDPDQTIYTWRGANVNFLLDFDKAFPGTRTIMMMENYRSTPQILDVCNSLISANKLRMEKNLVPAGGAVARPGFSDGTGGTAALDGDCEFSGVIETPMGDYAAASTHKAHPVTYHHAQTSEQEALWVIEEIEKLREKGMAYRDMAVLYRAHYVTKTLEEVFLCKQVPYQIYSGTPFFERMEIKDALSYLRMIVYKDDLSFVRVANKPKRNLGMRRMKFLKEYAESRGCTLYQALIENLESPEIKSSRAGDFVGLIEGYNKTYAGARVSEVLSGILGDSGYEELLRTEGSQDRLDNLAELKQAVHEFEVTCGEETTLESYLAHVALFTNGDVAEKGDKVKFMTVHAAKGLEFTAVFLCGLNEGIFPSKKVKTRRQMEEERRLAFVAMTRAEEVLYLSEAAGRNHDGSFRYPSRFIMDVDQKLLKYTETVDETLLDKGREQVKLAERSLRPEPDEIEFGPGSRVRHQIFGDGLVKAVDMEMGTYVIKFDKMETERKITFRAKLEKA